MRSFLEVGKVTRGYSRPKPRQFVARRDRPVGQCPEATIAEKKRLKLASNGFKHERLDGKFRKKKLTIMRR